MIILQLYMRNSINLLKTFETHQIVGIPIKKIMLLLLADLVSIKLITKRSEKA